MRIMKGGLDIPPEFSEDIQRVGEAEQGYARSSDRVSLDAAAGSMEHIILHPAFSTADMRFQLAAIKNASSVFRRIYEKSGQVDDLHRTMHLLQLGVDLASGGSPELTMFLAALGPA